MRDKCVWSAQICAAIAKQKRIQVAEALLEVPGGQVLETGAPHEAQIFIFWLCYAKGWFRCPFFCRCMFC